MSWYPLPPTVVTSLHTQLPETFRKLVVTEWSRANKQGAKVESFLEGPCFDAAGNLHVVDIPHGRIFRISPGGDWRVLAEYDGEPNGLALHPDGRIFIADYKNGIMALSPEGGTPKPVLTRRNGERFKGPNDLIFAGNGDLYFTDQGQTGLQDPTGRVYRFTLEGRLDCLIDNGPSPNGLALSPAQDVLFVAMTRDNAIWRLPLLPSGGTAKVGRFASFHGTSGPDGLAMDRHGRLFVAHASLGSAFMLGPQGEPLARIGTNGHTITNLCFGPGRDETKLVMTESGTGRILRADLSGAGSHVAL